MNKIEPYLTRIESVCGGQGRFFRITEENERPPIMVISYENLPEHGCITAFSFGLSSVAHSEWVNCRPELVISVNSTDNAWPLAMGEMIRNGRERCLFSFGTVLNFGQKVSVESEMTSFLVFACSILEEADLTVHLSDRKIYLAQIYPIHHSEASLIERIGPERFVLQLGTDLFDVKRPPCR